MPKKANGGFCYIGWNQCKRVFGLCAFASRHGPKEKQRPCGRSFIKQNYERSLLFCAEGLSNKPASIKRIGIGFLYGNPHRRIYLPVGAFPVDVLQSTQPPAWGWALFLFPALTSAKLFHRQGKPLADSCPPCLKSFTGTFLFPFRL